MNIDPAAQASYRVPRSEVDGFFIPGEELGASRVTTGVIVSVDSSNTCTVLMMDENISGVLWLGRIPPRIGDVVAVESRGDHLVIAATNDINYFLEGAEDDAVSIVSDEDPGNPPPLPIEVGGSMRSEEAWEFYGAEMKNWTRQLAESGQGMRVYQPTPPVFQARNYITIPNFEAGHENPADALRSWKTDGNGTEIAVSTERALTGTMSLKTTWGPTVASGDQVWLRVDGLTSGQQYTAQCWVWVPTGSPDVSLLIYGVTSSAATAVKDAWVQLTVTFTASGTFDYIGPATVTAVPGAIMYLDAVSVVAGATPLTTYFDGATLDTNTDQFIWLGVPHLSASEWYKGATNPAVKLATNLIPNPSFETNLTGYGTISASYSRVTEEKYSGSYSCKLVSVTAGAAYSALAFDISGVLSGHAYTVSAWVKWGDRTGVISIVPVGSFASGNPADPGQPATGEWQRVSFTFTATVNSVAGDRFDIHFTPAIPQEAGSLVVFIDSVMLVETTASSGPQTPYFDGSLPATPDRYYRWEGPSDLSQSTMWTAAPTAPPGLLATLWSEESFEVHPGDKIDVSAHLTEIVPSSTAQISILYGPTEGVIPTPVSARTNLLPNPSFEVDLSTWSAVRATIAKVLTSGSVAAYSGTYMLQATNDATTSTHYVITGPTSILAPPVGTPLTFSGSARLVSGSAPGYTAQLYFYDAASVAVPSGAVATGPATALVGGAWTRLSVTTVVPAGAVYVRAAINSQAGVASAVWVADALMLEESSEVGSYIEGTVLDPPSTDVVVVPQGSATPVLTTDTLVSAVVTVPDTLAFPTSGTVPPQMARIGVKLVGDGDSQALMTAAAATLTPKAWPLGSTWHDPDAPEGGLITIGETASAGTNATLVNTTTDTPIPTPAKKVIITAPPTMGGVAIVTFSGSFQVKQSVSSTYLTLWAGATLISTVYVVAPNDAGTFPFTMRGSYQLAPGEEVEIVPKYRYSGASTTVPHLLVRLITAAEFYPGAVRSGASSDPATRWWDGDSWRPEINKAASFDMSVDATTGPAGKTVTATTLVRSPATLHAGAVLNLTATVTAGGAGKVTFYKSTSASGPWTSLGSSTISATKATKAWTAAAGLWYFKATYVGSATHAASSSAASAVTTVQKLVSKTINLPCAWVQPYKESGAKVTGSGHDLAVQQGYVSATYGNRKSLLRFNHSAIPAAADITGATLICAAGGWKQWANNTGTLVVGSFTGNTTAPTTWPGAATTEDRSRHTVDEGGWSVNLSSWAKSVLESASFSGLTIGPGPSNSALYFGLSVAAGAAQFTLKVTYSVWE